MSAIMSASAACRTVLGAFVTSSALRALSAAAGIVHAMGIDTGGALPEMKAFYG
jgi:hypothetical protein